jgi:hypothetical protein
MHCLGGWPAAVVVPHWLVVLGGEVGIDVVELATSVLEANRCLEGVGAGHVLVEPSPQQSDEAVHHALAGAGGLRARKLPGQRPSAPRRWPDATLASGWAASQRTPMRGTTAPHSGQVCVEWLTGAEDERFLRTSIPRGDRRIDGRGLGPSQQEAPCRPRWPKIVAAAPSRCPLPVWIGGHGPAAGGLVARAAPAAGCHNGEGLVPEIAWAVPGTVGLYPADGADHAHPSDRPDTSCNLE